MQSKVTSRLRCQLKGGREVLFQELDLSGLEGLSEENQVAAHTLLAEYHEISSL